LFVHLDEWSDRFLRNNCLCLAVHMVLHPCSSSVSSHLSSNTFYTPHIKKIAQNWASLALANIQFCIPYFKKMSKEEEEESCKRVSVLVSDIKTPWHESVSELYRPSNRHLSVRLVPTFADRVPGYRFRGPGSIPGATRFSEK
jgi:hypothetical protein